MPQTNEYLTMPFVDRGRYPTFTNPEEAAAAEQAATEEKQKSAFLKGVESRIAGAPSSGTVDVRAMLEQAGADLEDPAVQWFIENLPPVMLREENRSTLQGAILNMASTHPRQPTQYESALATAGFSGPFTGENAMVGGPAGRLVGQEGLSVATFTEDKPKFERNDETGWIRYKNGVLVSPDGEVVFDPSSKAPGSLAWQRETVSSWDQGQVSMWANRLVEYGYLTKQQAKKAATNDPAFLNALSQYHLTRYAYGKPMQGELAGVSGAAGGPKKPLVDVTDLKAQARNDIREQYRRVFGEDPTDGEVEAWSDWLLSKTMELQKKFRKGTGHPNYAGDAATEAEERMIERIEGSPKAQFLADSEEENTRLRDALQQAVVVTNSLAG